MNNFFPSALFSAINAPMKIPCLLALVALLPLFSAHAQYEVTLHMSKIEYVAQEPMVAKVTITNRSGADVILGGPSGKAWLSFNVRDSSDPTGEAALIFF